MNFGDPEELKVRASEYGAQFLPPGSGPRPMPRPQAPAAGAGAALLENPASTPPPMPQHEPPQLMAGGPPSSPGPVSATVAPGQPTDEGWPDWMTDDDKKFAEQSKKAAQNYYGAVGKRRQARAQAAEFRKLLKERDSAHATMEDLTGMMAGAKELFMDEDGKTPNAHGLAVIRQLSKARQKYKRAKQKEQDYLKQFQQSGKKVPEGRDITDDDLLALENADDDAFDDNIGRGHAQALAYLGE